MLPPPPQNLKRNGDLIVSFQAFAGERSCGLCRCFSKVSTFLPITVSSFASILRTMASAAHTRLLRLGRQLQAATSGTASSLTRLKSIGCVPSPDQFVGTGETNGVSYDLSPSSSSNGGPSCSPKESQRRVRGSARGQEGRDGIEATKNNSPLPISLTSFSSDALFSLTEDNYSLSSFSLSPSKRNMTTTTHVPSDGAGVHTPENRLKQQSQHQSSSIPVSKRADSLNTTCRDLRNSNDVPSISSSNSSFLYHPSSGSVSLSCPAKSRSFFPSPFSSCSYSSSSSSSCLKTARNSSLPGPGAVWSSDLLIEHCDKSTNDSGKKGGCVVLKLNRPEKLNALSLDVITALRWIIPTLEADPRCSLLCLAGQGSKAFCAGGDVRSLARAPLLQVQQFFGQEFSLIYTLSQMAKPYIALWNGISMGQSLSLPCLSTYVYIHI